MEAEIIKLQSNKPNHGATAALRRAWTWTKQQLTNPWAKTTALALAGPVGLPIALSTIIAGTDLYTTGKMPPIGRLAIGTAVVGGCIGALEAAAVILVAGMYLAMSHVDNRESKERASAAKQPTRPNQQVLPVNLNWQPDLEEHQVIAFPHGAAKPPSAPTLAPQ